MADTVPQNRAWSFRRGLRVLLGLVATGVIALAGYGLVLSAALTLPRSDEHPPLLIYGAPFMVSPGLDVTGSGLVDRLRQLGYRSVSVSPRAAGDYVVASDSLEIFLHPQPESRLPAKIVRLVLVAGKIRELRSMPDGRPIPWVFLEPAVISGMRDGSKQVREWIPLDRIPPRLIDMVLAIEDRRFFSHVGLDPLAIGRALWANLVHGAVVQGGSTLTQQLAKNLYYSPQRTISRKLKELIAAVILELKYSKQEILESYLNEIYLGQFGSVSIYGVGEAARRYFGKSLDELSVEEMAMIVGLIKGPNSYSPMRNVAQATDRRNVVLRRLMEQGIISDEVWEEATKRSVKIVPGRDAVGDAPHFVDYLLREVEDAVGDLPEGIRIFSTLDPWIQRTAEQVLQQGLVQLETTYPWLKEGGQSLQGAVVVLEPKTGRIRAMVGGRDYRTSQFNRAAQARRSAGSLLKPFVYLAGFEAARTQGAAGLTPATLLDDGPVTLESKGGPWSPKNYDRQYHGQVTVRTALEQSLNIPAVRVAHRTGLAPFLNLLRTFGIATPQPGDLSVALGSSPVSLLEIASAYGGLANGGVMVRPSPVSHIDGETGETVWSRIVDRRQAASPQGTYLVTSLLKGVIDRGTGAKARRLGVEGAVAGKTGTTDGYRDAWFVGYTTDLVIGVWVGFDDERPIKLTGAQAALPIWSKLAARLIPPDQPDFPMPEGVVERRIDPQTGQLATAQCPEPITEVFMAGTEPADYCEIHGGGLWERLKRAFGLL
ncbi:MAG: PBP1A family penicillin-binding protein [Nitrospira sp.]|nr:PBP1A family penicillin-binding protein [Nitrospira sp.]MCP9441768.1 PBP1A family penicillin-binding protein [Nitrospira sp.]